MAQEAAKQRIQKQFGREKGERFTATIDKEGQKKLEGLSRLIMKNLEQARNTGKQRRWRKQQAADKMTKKVIEVIEDVIQKNITVRSNIRSFDMNPETAIADAPPQAIDTPAPEYTQGGLPVGPVESPLEDGGNF